MCLLVEDVPYSKLESLVFKGYKVFNNQYGRLRSPFLFRELSYSGWSIETYYNEKYFYEDLIGGHHIHGLEFRKEFDLVKGKEDFYQTYFFNIKAFENNYLVCKASYTPAGDKSKHKKQTIEKIEYFLDKKDKGTLRQRDIIRAFRFLKNSF